MAEIEIKRVNFFDGQFLKQDEFIAFDAYHRHMRRRWAYVMFDKSGVVQVGNDDLTLVAPAPAQPGSKKVLVKKGMAIGKKVDELEAREIVLQVDTEIDLLEARWNLASGDVAVITVHYKEELTEHRSDGDESDFTRIKESAEIHVHKGESGLAGAPQVDAPYVRLGDVPFDTVLKTDGTLNKDEQKRAVAFLNPALFAAVGPTPQITLTPNVGGAGNSFSIEVTSSTGFDVSGVAVSDVTVTPANSGISNLAVSHVPLNSLQITGTVDSNAAAGPRTVTITRGALSAQATFTVQAGMSVTSFTGVDQTVAAPDPRKDHLIINGTGFTAGQPATIVFAGTATQAQRTIVVPDAILGGNVTSNQIMIPIALIPDAAAAGTATVSHNGDIKNLSLTPPAKCGTLPVLVDATGFLTLNGVRFVAPLQIKIGSITESTSSGFPDAGLQEALTTTSIKLAMEGREQGTTRTIIITTPGGTIVPGSITIT